MLHAHLPWVRQNGVHPAGEEWLFQACAETYVPLLELLERLAHDGHRDLLTLGLTPVLLEQLDDPDLLAELHGWLGRRVWDVAQTVARHPAPDRPQLEPVWEHHWRRQRRLLGFVEERVLGRGFGPLFAELADAGVIELLGGPATHPQLALMDDADLLDAQVEEGLALGAAHLGRRPRGAWTPECAYRPEGSVADPLSFRRGDEMARTDARLPGLEQVWQASGVDHLVLDAPTLARAVGAHRDWAVTGGRVEPPGSSLDVLDRPVLVGDSDLAAFGRNLAVSYQVWSPTGGYPGDPWYRDFHTVDLDGGLKSWRVGDKRAIRKPAYEPSAAAGRVRAHVDDIVGLLHRHALGRPREAVAVAAYDAELFGHWWYEGPAWLEGLLRRLAVDPVLRPTTLASHLERHPPRRRLDLPESSWGSGKDLRAWVDERTRWIWEAIRAAEERFRRLPLAAPGRAQAWRQLTLLQSSDWPFMVTTNQAASYAEERVAAHVARFEQACAGEDLDELADRDGPLAASTATGQRTMESALRT